MKTRINTRYRKFVTTASLLVGFLFMPMTVSHAEEKANATEDVNSNDLVILNWSEYLDPELVEKFEKQYNAKIKEIYFESDDYRDNYMLETQGKGIDVIVVNGIKVRQYKQQNWIAPISEKDVPNLRYIDKKWLSLFEEAEGYVMPYFWGTLGIAYRKDIIKSEVSSWKHLYQPDEVLRNKIAMISASRDMIGMALKALGYSSNSSNFNELAKAKELLLQQKPYVRDYVYINLDEESSLVTGEILMTMMYSGDAMTLQEYDENIAYVVPAEGGNLWADYLVVSNASTKKQLAYDFINFLNQPEHAAQLAEYVYYATPNTAAEKLLPEEFKSDKNIYPPQDVLDSSEIYKKLPSRVTRFRNEIFSLVTQ